MVYVLHKQYLLLCGSREVVLNFIETNVKEDMNSPLPAFENFTIRYLLVHVINTYLHWLKGFGLSLPLELASDRDFKSISAIRPLYEEVNNITAIFLKRFDGQLELPITGTLSGNRVVTASPFQLFTHVITHEFHHKGQIMSMCRLLGHVPPDTDVIRF